VQVAFLIDVTVGASYGGLISTPGAVIERVGGWELVVVVGDGIGARVGVMTGTCQVVDVVEEDWGALVDVARSGAWTPPDRGPGASALITPFVVVVVVLAAVDGTGIVAVVVGACRTAVEAVNDDGSAPEAWVIGAPPSEHPKRRNPMPPTRRHAIVREREVTPLQRSLATFMTVVEHQDPWVPLPPPCTQCPRLGHGGMALGTSLRVYVTPAGATAPTPAMGGISRNPLTGWAE
jgi:hypothetical protein